MTQATLVEHAKPSSAERKLWHAVISQMLEDGLNTNTSVKITRNREAARDWFKHRGSGFRYVCDLADIADPDKLADRALTLFAEADRKPPKTPRPRMAPGVGQRFPASALDRRVSTAQDRA